VVVVLEAVSRAAEVVGEVRLVDVVRDAARERERAATAAETLGERGGIVPRAARLEDVLRDGGIVGEKVTERLAARVVVGRIGADAQMADGELVAHRTRRLELFGRRLGRLERRHARAERADAEP